MTGSGWSRPRLAAGLLACVLVIAGATSEVRAHALLDRSDPAPGVALPADQPPRRISLWFTEPVTVRPDAVRIVDVANSRQGGSHARVAAGVLTRVDLDVDGLTSGAYVVRWRVTSADNHVARGAYWFVVGYAPAPPPNVALSGSGAPRVAMLEVLARWLGLVATLALAGAAFAPLLMFRPVVARLTRVTVLAMTGLLVAALLLLAALQAAALAERPVIEALDAATIGTVLFDSRFGALWWARLALGVLLGSVLVRSASGGDRGRARSLTAPLLAFLLLLGTALAGHAAGGRGALPSMMVLAADTIHLGAGALWLGGLFLLASWLGRRDDPRPAGSLATLVPRVSRVAMASVATLVLTGALNTYAQIGHPSALISTAYGQSLVLKLAVMLALLAVAAVNRLGVRPRIAAGGAGTDDRWPVRLRALVGGELVLGALMLLAVGLLGSLSPPGDKAPPTSWKDASRVSDLDVTLVIHPNWVGISRFRVTLADTRGLPPDDVSQVTLTFAMEGMNMGRTHVTLAPRGHGEYETQGFYVGMPGISQVQVGVTRTAGADRRALFRIEVPDVNAAQFSGLAAALGIAVTTAGADSAVTDAASLARGRDLYQDRCAVCHGNAGRGDGPAAASLLPPPADLTLHARWHPDEQLFWFISHGVAGTSMVGFGDRLAAHERWDVINHVRALASAPGATPPPAAPVTSPPAGAATPEPPSGRERPQPPPPIGPVAPALTGRLVFGPDVDNNLWLLSLPDARPQPLTRLGLLEFASNPVWAPGGSRIAFSYYRLPGGDAIPVPDGTDLYLIDADGGGLRALARHDATGAVFQYPAWSADGAAVYASYLGPGGAGSGIERIDVRSGVRARVVANAGFPSLSRDGRVLAYVQFAVPPSRGPSIWWSAPDGSGAHQVVGPTVFDKLFGARLAPDGKRVLFAAVGQPATSSPTGLLRHLLAPVPAFANGDLWDLWVVDLDGRNLHPITALSEDLPVAAWSPDGGSIAFLGGGSARTAEAGLTIIGADGTGLRRLTAQPGHRGVDWARPAAPETRPR